MATKPQFVTNEEAVERFNLIDYEPFGEMDFSLVVLLDGDTYIKGDLQAWFEKIIEDNDLENEDSLILINGDLIVDGTVAPGYDSFPFLFVTGNLKCDVLQSYDECIYILGNAYIKYVFDGNYNDGSIVIEGTTHVPYLLNSDHMSEINPQGAILINYYSDYDDFFNYDFTPKDFDRVMIPELLDNDGYLVQHKFIEIVKSGKSPLKEGAKPKKLIFEEEIDKMTSENNKDNIITLDLSDKKLKEFPEKILKLKNLKVLILTENEINEIPKNINKLENLEELYLNNCNLSKLPNELSELKNLRILDISHNGALILPENIGELQDLKELYLNYNLNFNFPDSFAKLKNLEVLKAYQCSDELPIDFPEIITKLTNLKILDIGSNSFKTIPNSFLELKNLEELNLNSSLCYLTELPDLSQLKNLKILKANGLISFTTRPKPEQSLLKYFFDITSLEELHIDRHGESKEVYNDESLNKLLKNLEYNPIKQAKVKACFTQKEGKDSSFGAAWNGMFNNGIMWDGLLRENLKEEQLYGIGKLKNLKVLDLSFNGLESLPEEIYNLQHLESINLTYNQNLSIKSLEKLYKTMPNTQINAQKIRTRIDIDDENFKKVNSLNKEASQKMQARNYLEAIKLFENALTLCTPDKKYSDYDELYAHYGIAYCLGYQVLGESDKDKHREMVKYLIEISEKTLEELIPAEHLIFYYTEEGAFQRECIRILGNSIAWYLSEDTTDINILNKALEHITRSVNNIEGSQHYFIYDTQVRILLKLNKIQEAYQIIYKVLRKNPDFNDFQEFKTDTSYLEWLKKM